jgi:hypothetical protein
MTIVKFFAVGDVAVKVVDLEHCFSSSGLTLDHPSFRGRAAEPGIQRADLRSAIAHFLIATPCIRSLAISKNAPFKPILRQAQESGSGAQGRASQYLVRGPVSRAPPVFLPRRRTGPLPLVSVKARTWGFITQQHTVLLPARHRRPPRASGS